MWGPWSLTIFGGLFAALLLVAIAFGTSAMFFGVLIVGGIAALIAALYVIGAVGRRSEPIEDPVEHGAPAAGEGTAGKPHGPGPEPSGVR
jgi:hypothetical protein